MKLIDLNYHTITEYASPLDVISRHWPSLGYIDFLQKDIDVEVIKHSSHEGEFEMNNTIYSFFERQNRFWQIPFGTHRYIREQAPAVVIIQGFIFPLQVIFLRLKLGKKTAIYLQHHGEAPFKGIKRWAQRFADRFVNGYLFASVDIAKEWIDAKIISSRRKCFEVMGVSSNFIREEKHSAQKKTGMNGNPNFLWVGRLNDNKDPLNVLKAFEKYLHMKPAAKLYMIYQEDDLLPEIRSMMNASELLDKGVRLIGAIPHAGLASWFSSADFFISGSHKEGSGYALIEAMSCGCIPVVTNIPSFATITDHGKCGVLYQPGNEASLLDALLRTHYLDQEAEEKKVIEQFNDHLSFKAYARQVQFIIDRSGRNK